MSIAANRAHRLSIKPAAIEAMDEADAGLLQRGDQVGDAVRGQAHVAVADHHDLARSRARPC